MIYPGAHAALISPTAFLPFLSSPAPHEHTQTIKTTLHTHIVRTTVTLLPNSYTN